MSNAEEGEKDVKGHDLQVKDEMEYPGVTKRALTMLSVYLSVFLITLASACYSPHQQCL